MLILFGGLLLVLSSILEFVLGNTFSSVVFGHLGKTSNLRDMNGSSGLTLAGAFCLAFGASMTPAFNAAGTFSPQLTTNSISKALTNNVLPSSVLRINHRHPGRSSQSRIRDNLRYAFNSPTQAQPVPH